MPKPAIERHLYQAQLACRAEEQLPEGVIGRVSGIALVYNVVDAWGTRFAPGSLDRTRREKLAAGRIQLFMAEDDGSHQYGTRKHVGTVRSLEDVGDNVVMGADLHDTEPAAELKRYLEAVVATNGFTGLSIGFRPRATQEATDENGDPILELTEVELAEITVTPIPAVPGARVLAVRTEPGEDEETTKESARVLALRSLLRTVPREVVTREIAARDATSPAPDDASASESSSEESATPGDEEQSQNPHPVPLADRVRAVRTVYGSI